MDSGSHRARREGVSLTLTPAELEALTGKVRPHAQAKVLDALEIDYKRRPNGTLVVQAQGMPHEPRQRPRREPIFEHIRSRA